MLKIFQYVVQKALHCIYINRNYEYKRSHPWAMVCDVCGHWTPALLIPQFLERQGSGGLDNRITSQIARHARKTQSQRCYKRPIKIIFNPSSTTRYTLHFFCNVSSDLLQVQISKYIFCSNLIHSEVLNPKIYI